MKISDVIKSGLKLRNLTIAQLSDEIGIPEATIYRLFKKDDYKLSSLIKIARFLDLNFFDLVKHKLGFTDHISWPTQEISDVEIQLRNQLDISMKRVKELEAQLEHNRQLIDLLNEKISERS